MTLNPLAGCPLLEPGITTARAGGVGWSFSNLPLDKSLKRESRQVLADEHRAMQVA